MLGLLLATVFTVCAPGALPACAHSPRTVSTSAPATQLLMHLNSARNAAHRQTLRVDPTLNDLAEADAQDMAHRRYFSHYSPDGRSLTDRIMAAHYLCEYAGENIAMAANENDAYRALLKSPEHLENMLNTHYTKVGIGVAAASNGVLLFVEEFSD